MTDLRYDLTRITFAVLFIAALIGASFWILRPFLPAVIWAATLVIATWPIMRHVQDRLWNSRALAVTIMTLALLLVFIVPLWLAISTIVNSSGQIVQWAEFLASSDLPPPPSWLGDLPLVGPKAANVWQSVGDAGFSEMLQKARPYAGTMTQWFVSAVGGSGMVLVQFLLTVAISAIMYARGERAAAVTCSASATLRRRRSGRGAIGSTISARPSTT